MRQDRADRLEALLRSLDPERTYTHEFVYFRITGFRPAKPAMETYGGADLRSDLVRMLRAISLSAPQATQDVPEKVLSLEEAAERFGVSKRTLARWRKAGLVARHYVFPDGRRRVGVRASALEGFAEDNPALVRRAEGFSLLTETERTDILRRARELARGGEANLTAAARRIAADVHRARETVRRVLLQHERESPEDALFGPRRAPAKDDERERIYRAYLSGQSVQALCNRSRLSRASVYRLINEARAQALLGDAEMPGPAVREQAFQEKDAEQQIVGEAPDVPAEPPLDAEQVRHLLRLYGYVKFRLEQARQRVNPRRYVAAQLLDEIELLIGTVRVIEARLLVEHLPLVLRVARQHTGGIVGLENIVSEGMLCLLRAVEEFDYTRETAYSSYASWALMRDFARTIPQEQFRAGKAAQQAPADEAVRSAVASAVRRQVDDLLGGVPEERRAAIRDRFGVAMAPVRDVIAALERAPSAPPARGERPSRRRKS